MKDFDRAELWAVRTMGEADFFWKQRPGIAARPAIRSRYGERLKAVYNRVFMRKGEEEFTS